jgi:hypothetical protein
MSAENATNSNDALNAEESVQNTEAPKRSGRKLKLLCNPSRLPKPKAPKARLQKKEELTAEERTKINDYFFDQKAKAIKKARDRGWVK